MAMFTLRDAIGLAQRANTPEGKIMYDSAIMGNYVLTPEQAANEVARRQTGAHLADAGSGLASSGLPSGKTVNHITLGDESPYAIQGLKAAQGGNWQQAQDSSWQYTPAQQTVDKYGQDRLLEYFNQNEKGNRLILPTIKVQR